MVNAGKLWTIDSSWLAVGERINVGVLVGIDVCVAVGVFCTSVGMGVSVGLSVMEIVGKMGSDSEACSVVGRSQLPRVKDNMHKIIVNLIMIFPYKQKSLPS